MVSSVCVTKSKIQIKLEKKYLTFSSCRSINFNKNSTKLLLQPQKKCNEIRQNC